MQKDALAPRYARQFGCTGPRCPDNCCQENWTISIDHGTYQLYRLDPQLGKLMQPYLQENNDLATKDFYPATLKQNIKTGGCDLQEKSGFCKIHKEFGINALSHTCAVYPRQYQPLGPDQLLSMNESCPEVARHLIEDQDALELEFGAVYAWDRLILVDQTEFNDAYHNRYALLQGLITILRYRAISLEKRLFICSLLVQRAERVIAEGQASELSMQDLLDLFSQLINEGYFDQQAALLKEKNDGALGLFIFSRLLDFPSKKGKFKEALDQVTSGLGIHDHKKLHIDHIQALDKARKKHLSSLEKQYPWMLENIVVNWVLFDLFPIHKERIKDGWLSITTRYLLLRSLLSGMGAAKKGLKKEDVIHLTYLFGRQVSSAPQRIASLQLELINKKFDDPASFVRALSF